MFQQLLFSTEAPIWLKGGKPSLLTPSAFKENKNLNSPVYFEFSSILEEMLTQEGIL